MSNQAQKASTKATKRILSVTIKRMIDESPDTSWIGDYSASPKNEFSIDRDHDETCPLFWANNDATDDDERECSCVEHERGTYRYFNPGSVESFDVNASWIPKGAENKRTYWFDAMRKNALSDYARSEAMNRGDFDFIGISAESDVQLAAPIGVWSNGGGPVYTTQTITSGGLLGIESDSDADYLKSIEDEQLAELREQLAAIGFSKRAISAAFRNIAHEEA